MCLSFKVEYSKDVVGRLKKLSRSDRKRIVEAIEKMASGDLSQVKRLKGVGDRFSRRVGDWRALFRLASDDDVLLIDHLGPRGSVYRRI